MLQSLLSCFSTRSRERQGSNHVDDKTSSLTWRLLLESSGTNLWKFRNDLLVIAVPGDDDDDSSHHHDQNSNTVQSPASFPSKNCGICLSSGYPAPPKTVCILSQASEFQTLEDGHHHHHHHHHQQGSLLDKLPVPPNNNGDVVAALPLTKCTGPEWQRQRRLIQQQGFSNILSLSLKAVEAVEWKINIDFNDDDDDNGNGVVDLKQAVLTASLQWLVLLFRGTNDPVLADAALSHWKAIRATPNKKKKAEIQTSFKALVAQLIFTDGGLLQELHQALVVVQEVGGEDDATKPASSSSTQKQREEQAELNSVYAMMAAFDAIQSLLFWTIWNIANVDNNKSSNDDDDDLWEECRQSILENDQGRQEQADLEGLMAFKKNSTQNEPTDLSKVSLLGRALIETVRVYPPIWTLPRRLLPRDGLQGTAVKFDVLMANGATDRQWDPRGMMKKHDTTRFPPVASFGIGKRHCPAGTAALVAAYKMLCSFVTTYKEVPKECHPGKAIASAYLGPTLCTEGPQFFYLKRQQHHDGETIREDQDATDLT